MAKEPQLQDLLPKRVDPPDLEPRASDLNFSWKAVVLAIAAIGVAFLAKLGIDGDISLKVAMIIAGVVAMAMVAPRLFADPTANRTTQRPTKVGPKGEDAS